MLKPKKVNKTKLIVCLVMIPVFVLVALSLLLGENIDIIKRALADGLSENQIRDILSELGLRGQITISVLAMLQVMVMVLPAEPVQVLGGLTFGFNVGFVLCLLGVIAGNSLIFVLYKLLGDRLRNYFDKNLNINFESVGKSAKLFVAIFVLYFLPAIPYGMIAFLAATAGMKYPRFLIVTTLGAIPSICIGVGLGHFALGSSIAMTLLVLIALIIILVVVMMKRDKLIEKVNEYLSKKNKSGTSVQMYNSKKLILPYIIFRLLTFGKIKFKTIERVEKIEHPSIVLCNHGAFIDFAYAGTVLKKESPNFIVNRMYFYEKWFAKLLRSFGCIPKSIFALDIESTMNCIKVIKRGGVLAMMPEARLSTVGKFEDIQESTYDFLKKIGVTVYAIKISGDYLAKPKWGSGLRRGSLVEARMSLLFTPDELASLEVREIKERTEKALNYNEFEWLEEHKEIKYRSKKIAEGLENVLTRCPSCGARYSLASKGKVVLCEKCGLKAEMNSRYGFVDRIPFANFADWYDWQFERLREEIVSNNDFTLTSKVELKHASKDGKTQLVTAGEGVCTLTRDGLVYVGTEFGENVEREFPISSIYRLLFGAGVDFEIYVGKELYFFVPEEKRSCVDWYMASMILTDLSNEP